VSGPGEDGEIAVTVEDEGWRALVPDAEALCVRAAKAALGHMHGEVGIVLADDARVAELNARYRHKQGPTNVLSFPIADGGPVPAGAPRLLGDVVLARETVAREARAQGKSAGHHLAHLVVHGVLHLLGLDHQAEAEAADMEARETAALARLGVPDPFRDSRDVA
jgi:probable rRNA maturation factor